VSALLEVRGLRAGYEGIPVVFGVDLDVEAGEVVALLGANGAGKTSLLRAISGMNEVFAGSVVFAAENLTHRPADLIARRGLLHVPANRGIFPSLAVDETLRLAAALTRSGRADATGRLEEAYATFPRLADRRGQAAGTLSGGEQQMLALARGLIARPRLLMVDEMSQGLAPTVVADLFEILKGFPERGVSVLLVEQFVSQALGVAKRAYVLEKGTVSYSGSAARLAADEEFVRGSYLGEAERAAAGAPGGRAAAGAPGGRAAAAGSGRAEPVSYLTEEVSISLPPALLRGLQERAARENLPVATLLRQVVEETMENMENKAGKAQARAASKGGRRRARA